MRVDFDCRIFGGTDGFNPAAFLENFFLAPFHDFVRARVIRVGVLNNVVLAKIIFQISVGQSVRVNRRELLNHLERDNPTRIDVLNALVAVEIFQIVAVLVDVFANLREQLIALLISDARPPTEVIQPEIFELQIVQRLEAGNLRHFLFDVNGHVADVDDSGLRAKAARSFGDDSGGVGIVEHPRVGRIFFHVADDLDDTAD